MTLTKINFFKKTLIITLFGIIITLFNPPSSGIASKTNTGIHTYTSSNLIHAQNLITKLNKNLVTYPTIISQFKQTDSKGNISYGWFVFAKNENKARIEYRNKPIRIIINNNSIMYEQTHLKEKSFIPLSSSPFRYIMSRGSNLSSKELSIKKVITSQKLYTVLTAIKSKPKLGSIKFYFNNKFKLCGWSIINNSGEKTTITLISPTFTRKAIPRYVFFTHRVLAVSFKSLQKH